MPDVCSEEGTGDLLVKVYSFLSLALLLCAVPAFANVTVTTPTNGAEVVGPFNLVATASSCSSQPIAAMGYSLDDSSNTTIIYGTSINAKVAATDGAHTLHVKSWGDEGASCVTSVPIIVVPDPTSEVPTYATVYKQVQNLTDWNEINDTGTNGSSTGIMQITGSPSLTGTAREFETAYTNYGGERYYAHVSSDSSTTNFLYDGWVYIGGSSAGIANIEMDMNQTMPNGQTAIFGFQCDGWSHTWDYTENGGTPTAPIDEWMHSQQYCNPRGWSTNAWHHVQIAYSRDQYGTIRYQSVWLDGVEQDLNIVAPSAFALGWGPSLLTNFQIDGSNTSGSSNVYLDNLTIYSW